MTLLIDPPNSAGHGRLWSHLASDESFEELHRFAASLGVPPRGFDRDHYDIPAERYDAVVAAGARPVSSRDLVEQLVRSGLRRSKRDVLGPRQAGRALVRPERLHIGDGVAVTSPSGPVNPARLGAGVAVLESWDLSVRVMPAVLGRHGTLPYLSAADDARAEDFVRAWCDPDVKAVFCARGGYGVQRMLDRLDWSMLAAAGPKLLVGFSDITALHQALASRLGLAGVHGPVVTSLGDADQQTRGHLRALLFHPSVPVSLTPVGAPSLVGGRADGVLAGGNLAMLAAQAGTSEVRPAAGSIAVLEDIGEELYRLDRMLTQLLRSGWFEDVRGIALGQFRDCGSSESLRALFLDRLAPLGVPLLWDLRIGHIADNLAFPFGVRAVIDADAGTLELVEPAVR